MAANAQCFLEGALVCLREQYCRVAGKEAIFISVQ